MTEPLNIWVLEDQEEILAGITKFLGERRGHSVVGFETVKEVVQAFRVIEGKSGLLPHVLLADFNLPDGTGDEAIRVAKEAGVARIIMMSGRPDENRPMAIALGVSFVAKPFDFPFLAFEIEEGHNPPPITEEFVAEQGS